MEESLPPGFRFHPTDEELISYYLTGKVSDVGFTSKAVAVVDLNKCEPWDLPAKASMGEKEWYFFSLRDRKYPTGLRTNRATEAGYWKTTGKDKEIFRAGSVLVGMKKTLVFYKGRAPRGEKSNWVMHEYRLESKHPFRSPKEEWVVCRVFQKSAVKKPQQITPMSSQQLPSDLESPCETNSNVNEFGDIELPNLNSNIANSSSRFINNISPQSSYHSDNNNANNIMNMNLNMNWAAVREAAAAAAANLPSLSWRPASSSQLLTSAAGLSMNSLLLKALQQRSYPPRESASTNDHHYNSYNMPQGVISGHLGSNDLSSNLQASSSKVLESVHEVQQQSEQPFNLDSIW